MLLTVVGVVQCALQVSQAAATIIYQSKSHEVDQVDRSAAKPPKLIETGVLINYGIQRQQHCNTS